jgi:hypothetical protein
MAQQVRPIPEVNYRYGPNAANERSLITRARDVAGQARELGADLTGILGGARHAGLDPDAYRPLVGAAITLGSSRLSVYAAGRALPALTAAELPSDVAFLSCLADAEDDATELLTSASVLAKKATAALDAALELAEDGETSADRAIGRERAAACEEAIGILAELDQRLRYAIGRIQAVPEALGETYESVYNLIRAGGLMPFDGRWLTGEADGLAPGPAGTPAPRRLATVTVLAALPGYLARHGWTRNGTWNGAHVWQLRNLARILVPPPGLADSGELAAAAVHVIARHEGRQPAEVLRDLTTGAAR